MEKTIIKLSDLRKTQELNVKEGERLILSDPCYEIENVRSGANFILNAKAGIWKYDFNKETKTLDLYELSSYHLVREEGINSSIFDKVEEFPVDSGQVGVFLEKSYQKDSLVENIQFEDDHFKDMNEKWYRACCEITCSEDDMGFVPNGFVTRTRYGDGTYSFGVKYALGTNEVAYIRIITSDICEHCGKEECNCEFCDECGYEMSECCCEFCDECGYEISECCCEFCYECDNLMEYCTCDEEDDEDNE